jgi:hypothetical protein
LVRLSLEEREAPRTCINGIGVLEFVLKLEKVFEPTERLLLLVVVVVVVVLVVVDWDLTSFCGGVSRGCVAIFKLGF